MPDPAFDGDREAVLFDMDGVILRDRGTDASVYERALDDVIAEWGVDVDTETRGLLSEHGYDVDFVTGCRRLGVDPVAFFARREERAVDRVRDRLAAGERELAPGVDVLADLAARYDLGLVSNNYDAIVRFVVDHFGLDAFDHVRGRPTGVRGYYTRKPSPHHLLAAMDDLGATRGLYVGDRGTDVLAATRAGLDSAFVERPHNDGADLPVEPTVRVDSLADLTEWPEATGRRRRS